MRYDADLLRGAAAADRLPGPGDEPPLQPHDNTKAESFIKTLKVEAVYRAQYEQAEGPEPQILAVNPR